MQRTFLYFPSIKYDHPFDEISFSNQGQSLSVIVLNPDNKDALIYFGGNGEAVVNNAESFQHLFVNKTIYLFNYRAYGGSTGKPTESGNFSDALALYKLVKEKHPNISVMGRSLGSGVATYLAANKEIDKLALITPYDSILNVAKNQFKFLPVQLLLKDHYNSASRANKVTSKVFIIAAENDQVIPLSHSEKLAQEFKQSLLSYHLIKNAGHNNLSDFDEYYELLSNFLNNN